MTGPGAFWYSGAAEAQLLAAGGAAAYSITGAVTVSLTPAATMLEGRVLAGAVTVTFTPAAAMLEGRGIVGAVTVSLTPTAVMLEGRTLAGAVTVVFTPAADMLFTPAGAAAYSIVGAVTVSLTPAALMEYEAFVPPAPAPTEVGMGGSSGLRKRRRRYPVIVEELEEQGERAELPASTAVGAPPETPDVAPPAPAPIHPRPHPVVVGRRSVVRPAAEAGIGAASPPAPFRVEAEIDDDELAVLVATTMFD